MKQTICDICGKEITPADIHLAVRFPVEVDETGIDVLDMHSICFAYLKRIVKKIMVEDEKLEI